MAKFDVFVGRDAELSLIDRLATTREGVSAILVDGEGGAGKTFLLNKLREIYSHQDDFVVIYYDLAEQPPGILREALHTADALGWDHFPQFRAKINDLASGEYDIADVRLPQLEQDALSTFAGELVYLLAGRRLIRLVDTLDAAAPGYLQEEEIFQYLKLFTDVLAIYAGRDVRRFLPRFEQALGKDHVSYMRLTSFSQVESREFFAEVDKQNRISSDMRAKLHFLTGGRPILLTLAAEWLSREVPLPEIASRSLADLKRLPDDTMSELQESFEFELVDQVRQLKGSLDRAVLYMAHIDRRNDAHTLSILLDIPLSEAQMLVRRLIDLSFVRHNPATGSCMLHDEMRNLVNEHAWPYVDLTGDVRDKLTRSIISQYYEPRIDALAQRIKAQLEPERGPVRRAEISDEEWESWRLEAECLCYYLKLSEQEGLAYFDERFAEAQRNNHLIRMQFLLDEMENSGYVDIRDRIDLRRAESLRMSGDLEQARAIAEAALQKSDPSVDNQISAHITLGWIAAPTDPEQAKQHFHTALTLAQQDQRAKLLSVLHNNLGQVYQFTYQLDQSTQHYQRAIRYSKEAGNQSLFASATNNLAYVYRLQGDLLQADARCRVALAHRKKLGIERDIAYSYLTKAEIDRDKGDLESAERYTKLALRSFDKVDEIRGKIMAYNSLANIHRHLDQYERAEVYLEQAVGLVKQIKDEHLWATVLDVYGREQRDHAVYLQEYDSVEDKARSAKLFQKAQQYLEQSVELAQRYGDQWLMTRGQLELTLVYFLSNSRPDTELAETLNQISEDASRLKYTILLGYVQELRAEMALRHHDYAQAAEHLGQAALLLSQFTGRETARFFDRLSDYLMDLELPPDASTTLAQGILAVIGDSVVGTPLQSLQILCEQILNFQTL